MEATFGAATRREGGGGSEVLGRRAQPSLGTVGGASVGAMGVLADIVAVDRSRWANLSSDEDEGECDDEGRDAWTAWFEDTAGDRDARKANAEGGELGEDWKVKAAKAVGKGFVGSAGAGFGNMKGDARAVSKGFVGSVGAGSGNMKGGRRVVGVGLRWLRRDRLRQHERRQDG